MIIFGLFLIVCGVAGYLSNPAKAKTALMSGGLFGTLSMAWGFLAQRGMAWSLTAGKVTTAFLAFVFSWRSVVTWGKVFSDGPEKLFAACLISAMLIAAVATFFYLLKKSE